MLFQKAVFQQHMLGGFAETLLGALCRKEHNLLADEIQSVIYDLAAVDFPTFFGEIIPRFLVEVPVSDEQRAHLLGKFSGESDLPTFTRQLGEFATDAFYFTVEG